MSAVTVAMAKAAQGAVWRGKDGALCPVCGQRMRMYCKQGQVRHCKCVKAGCLLNELRLGVKAMPEEA